MLGPGPSPVLGTGQHTRMSTARPGDSQTCPSPSTCSSPRCEQEERPLPSSRPGGLTWPWLQLRSQCSCTISLKGGQAGWGVNLPRGRWTSLGVTASFFTDVDRVTLMSAVCCWTLSWCCAVGAHRKCNGKTLCASCPYPRAAAEAGHPLCAGYRVLHRPTGKSSKGLVEARMRHVHPKPKQRLSLPLLSVHTLRARCARGQGLVKKTEEACWPQGGRAASGSSAGRGEVGTRARAGRKGSPQHPALPPHPGHSHRTNQNKPPEGRGDPDVLS